MKRPRGKSLFAALFVSALSMGVAVAPRVARADAVTIPFAKAKLANGLTVILHEDRTLPIVVVNVSYNVGSRFEAPKRTGFAHLFEHLMFMGTRRVPEGTFDGWMEAAGGWNNAWTSEDRTDYYDVGPPTALKLLLWLEADRMSDLGPLMTIEKLNKQRDVVRNERRQNTENTPYGIGELRIPELLYSPSHPYHHPVIGSHEDLQAATVDDVKAFFATYYDPSNASLVVAGDFDPREAMKQIEAQLGAVPKKGKPKDPGAPGFDDKVTTLTAVVRETVQDRVELPKITMAWQSPKHFAPGDAELDLLSSVLAGGKASRLYQSLVFEKKLAQSVGASQSSGTLGSRFVVEVIARPGVSLDALEAEIDAELARVRREPVTEEELLRAKNVTSTSFVTRLQSVRERASLLNMYEAELGDPGFVQKDMDRYVKATTRDLFAVATRVLSPTARVILRIVPRPEKAEGK